MKQYLTDLTDDIIGSKKFHEKMRDHFLNEDGSLKTNEFRTFVALTLKIRSGPGSQSGVVQKMRQETLAKIICSFKKVNTGLSTEVTELLPLPPCLNNHSAETLLRHMAAACLAFIICDRLDPKAGRNVLPEYRRPRQEPRRGMDPRREALA